MTRAKLNPDRLVQELQTHVAEIADEARRGDYDARAWLCESFPGHTAYFHAVWNQQQHFSTRSTREGLFSCRTGWPVRGLTDHPGEG